MSWDDWEYLWKRPQLPVAKNADLASLIESYEPKRRKTEKLLVARDVTEATAGVIVMLAVGFMIWKAKAFIWIFVVALVLVAGVTVFFARERFRARGRRLGADAAMLEKLAADIAELRHQRRLVWNVG